MIHGIGIDLIEIERIRKVLYKQPKLVDRVLTENEKLKFEKFTHEKRKIEFLAGRFAVKELLVKHWVQG